MKKLSSSRAVAAGGILRAATVTLLVLAMSTACSEKKSAWDDNAQKFFKPVESDIIDDTDTGLQIVKDVINITFDPRTDEETINKIVASVGGEIVGYDRGINLYQVRFKGKGLTDIDDIRKKLLSGHKQVEAATRLSTSAHKDPYYAK